MYIFIFCIFDTMPRLPVYLIKFTALKNTLYSEIVSDRCGGDTKSEGVIWSFQALELLLEAFRPFQ